MRCVQKNPCFWNLKVEFQIFKKMCQHIPAASEKSCLEIIYLFKEL